MTTIRETLHTARQILKGISDNVNFETRLLFSEILQKPSSWVYAHLDESLTDKQHHLLMVAIEKRATGYPLAYILGKWGFYQWDFVVTEDVLIPRPETELLVEMAYEWAKHKTDVMIVDVGTGSGIIGISMALLLPNATVFATDISPKALAVAQQNAQALQANATFLEGHLLNPIPSNTQFDLILANLPYVPQTKAPELEVTKWEPHLALFSDDDGLTLIRELLKQAPYYLKAGGQIILEIDIEQGERVKSLAQEVFPDAEVLVKQDLTRRDRFITIQTAS